MFYIGFHLRRVVAHIIILFLEALQQEEIFCHISVLFQILYGLVVRCTVPIGYNFHSIHS
jgi:hypothetical protein